MEINSNLTMSQAYDIIKNYEKTIQDFYKALLDGFSDLPQASPIEKDTTGNLPTYRSKRENPEEFLRNKKNPECIDHTLLEKLYKLHYISSIDLAGSLSDLKDAYEIARTLE